MMVRLCPERVRKAARATHKWVKDLVKEDLHISKNTYFKAASGEPVSYSVAVNIAHGLNCTVEELLAEPEAGAEAEGGNANEPGSQDQ